MSSHEHEDKTIFLCNKGHSISGENAKRYFRSDTNDFYLECRRCAIERGRQYRAKLRNMKARAREMLRNRRD
jgi:hypothetical protein